MRYNTIASVNVPFSQIRLPPTHYSQSLPRYLRHTRPDADVRLSRAGSAGHPPKEYPRTTTTMHSNKLCRNPSPTEPTTPPNVRPRCAQRYLLQRLTTPFSC